MGRVRSLARRSPSDRRVARQTFWMGSMTGVEVVRGLAQVSITARILGPEGFGALAVIVAVSTLIHGLLALPGGDTVTTFVTRSVTEGRREEAGAILRLTMVVSQGLSLAAYAVVVALALTASSLLSISESHVNALLLYGLLGVFLATRSETLAVLRLADRMNLGLAVTVAATLMSLGLIVLAWRTDGGLPAVVTAYVAAAAVSGIGMFAAAAASARKASVAGFLTSFSLRSPSDVVRFQFGTFARTKLGTLSQNLDSVLMAQLAAPAEVGIYRAARGIMDMVRRPFQLIRFGVQPEYSRQWYSGQRAELRRSFRRVTIMSLSVAVVGFALLAILHRPIIRLVLGEGFAEASSPLLIMIPGAFVASTAVYSVLPVSTGRTWPVLVSGTGAILASVLVLLWLVPQFGAEGAAWARTTYALVSALILLPFMVPILKQDHSTQTATAAAARKQSSGNDLASPGS